MDFIQIIIATIQQQSTMAEINEEMTLDEIRTAGLKQAIGKEANLRRYIQADLVKMNKLFAKSLGVLVKMDVAIENITELVWEYVDINENWWSGQSEEVGVYSIIDDYTNKKGQTSKAHYTENRKYLKPAKQGDKPISYKGYFRVTRKKFDFNIKYDITTGWEIEFSPK